MPAQRDITNRDVLRRLQLCIVQRPFDAQNLGRAQELTTEQILRAVSWAIGTIRDYEAKDNAKVHPEPAKAEEPINDGDEYPYFY
jgi:hypothetical protein